MTQTPTLRTFTAASEFITGGDAWPWIQNTSQWLTERSEVLHPAALFLLIGAGTVIGLQGSSSIKTKASSTLLLSWVLVVNTGDMSFGTWALLILMFVLGSLRHLANGPDHWGSEGLDRWSFEILAAFLGVLLAPFYALTFAVEFLIGRKHRDAPEQPGTSTGKGARQV